MVPTLLGALGVADPPTVAIDVQADDITTDPVLTVQTALIVGADPSADPSSPPAEGERARVTRTDDPDAAAQVGARWRARCPADHHARRR